jgi:alpha-1,4-digalacturonate transport system permease protein
MNRRATAIRCLASAILVLAFAYPYLWMVLSAFKENREIYTPSQLFPTHWETRYFAELLAGKYIDFNRAFLCSLTIAAIQSIGSVFLSATTGFALARYKFPGKTLLFLTALLLIVLPRQTFSIPLFEWMSTLGLHGTIWSVILPGLLSGIGILFFLQIFKTISQSYFDLASMEGASPARTFLLLLPMVGPALLCYGTLHFILAWHEHLVPLLLLSDENRTLPLALATLHDPSQRVPQAVVLAASTFTLAPVALLFALFYRQFKSAMSDVLVH